MSLKYYEPGWTGTLADGTPVVTVRGDQIPEAWWKVLQVECARVGTSWSAHAVGNSNVLGWHAFDSLPEGVVHGGSIRVHLTDEERARYTTLVPTKYIEPEKNEFGLVIP